MQLAQDIYAQRNKDSLLKPARSCFKPIRVYNKYINETLYVDCRKCPACLHNKGVELTNKVAQECKQHRYNFFVTLTFDNDHLPLFTLKSGTTFVGNRPIAYNKLTKSYVYPEIDVSKVDDFDLATIHPQKMDEDKICFGYCNKYDLQTFIKRLRINLERSNVPCLIHGKKKYLKSKQLFKLPKNEKKIRYFFCSEYGPTTFRPHYHGIISTDNEYVAKYLERYLPTFWSKCDSSRVDVQLVSGSAPQYVAKYVTGFTHLPKVLQTEYTRPFYLSSKNPGFGSFKVDFDEVKSVLYNGVVEHLDRRDVKGETVFTYVPYSISYLSKYFPTPQGFGLPSDFDKLSLYEKYERGRYEKKYKMNEYGEKVFDAASSRKYAHASMNYLLSTDYSQQDYRFWKMTKFWTSRPFHFPLMEHGRLTGEKVYKKLELREYFGLLDKLYTNVKLNTLRKFYLSQESIDDALPYLSTFHRIKDWFYLSNYTHILRELPYFMTRERFNSKKCVDDTWCIFNQMSIQYEELYDSDGYLRLDVVDSMTDSHIITSSFRKELYDKILKNEKKKKYNEFYTNLHT